MQNQFLLSNSNFFSVQVTKIAVDGFFDQVRVFWIVLFFSCAYCKTSDNLFPKVKVCVAARQRCARVSVYCLLFLGKLCCLMVAFVQCNLLPLTGHRKT